VKSDDYPTTTETHTERYQWSEWQYELITEYIDLMLYMDELRASHDDFLEE
jgi:hypothetical protein